MRDRDTCQTALENLTWHALAWDGFTHAREVLEGWALAQNVTANVEQPDQVAYVKLIPDSGVSAIAFADAALPDVQILTMVCCDDGWWRAWGLSRNRMPCYGGSGHRSAKLMLVSRLLRHEIGRASCRERVF